MKVSKITSSSDINFKSAMFLKGPYKEILECRTYLKRNWERLGSTLVDEFTILPENFRPRPDQYVESFEAEGFHADDLRTKLAELKDYRRTHSKKEEEKEPFFTLNNVRHMPFKAVFQTKELLPSLRNGSFDYVMVKKRD